MTLGITVVSSAVIGGMMTGLIGCIGLGIIIWSAITSLVNDGATTFIRNSNHVLTSNLSIDFYVSRTIFRTFITFGHHILLYFAAVAFGLIHLGPTALLAVPGILLLFINGYWVVMLFALLCARFPRSRADHPQSAAACVLRHRRILELSPGCARSRRHRRRQRAVLFPRDHSRAPARRSA